MQSSAIKTSVVLIVCFYLLVDFFYFCDGINIKGYVFCRYFALYFLLSFRRKMSFLFDLSFYPSFCINNCNLCLLYVKQEGVS